MKYRVEVIADSSGDWCTNGKEYPSLAEAKAAALDLQARWMLVTNWRVVPIDGLD